MSKVIQFPTAADAFLPFREAVAADSAGRPEREKSATPSPEERHVRIMDALFGGSNGR